MSTDRRREPRFSSDQTLVIDVLATPTGGAPFLATIIDVSRSGVSVRSPHRIPPGAALQIQGDDVLFLGEVVYCRPDGPSFTCGLRVDHALEGLADLSRLCVKLFGPDCVAMTGTAPASRCRPPQCTT